MPSLSDFYISSPEALTLPVNTVTYNDGGTTNLDHGLGNVFSLTTNGTGTTIAHLNVPSERYSFELHLQWISGTITWPTSWTKGDTAPTTTGGYVITGVTVDGGISWKISVLSAGLWTPAYITTSLWLDAADNSTITTVSGAVSQWNDKSGNSRNATQSTSGNRPTYDATKFNGKPTITFDGLNDSLNLVQFNQSSGQNIFAVVDTTNLQSGYRLFLERSSAAANNLALYLGDGSSGTTHDYKPNIYWSISATRWNASVRTKAIVRWAFSTGSPASGTVQVDGQTEVTTTFTASALTQWLSINNSSVQQGAYDLSELLIIANPSSSTKQRIEGYLAHKWGLTGNLPSDHPYKNTPPIS